MARIIISCSNILRARETSLSTKKESRGDADKKGNGSKSSVRNGGRRREQRGKEPATKQKPASKKSAERKVIHRTSKTYETMWKPSEMCLFGENAR